MIERIKNSEVDSERVSHISTPIDNYLNDFDFSNRIVQKPWGYEYLMYQKGDVSIWVLYIKSDHLTSMHCHVNKKTALLVLSGEAIFTTLEKGFSLKEGDGLVIDKRTFHSTQSISNRGTIIMEVETPSQKADLLRLSDNYGRETKGYESQEHVSQNISEYESIFFKGDEFNVIKKIKNMALSLGKFDNVEDIKNYFEKERNGIGIILNGTLDNLGKGEIFYIKDLLNFNALNTILPLEILCAKDSGK